MRFASFFAFAGLAATGLGKPILGNIVNGVVDKVGGVVEGLPVFGGALEPVTDILAGVTKIVPVPIRAKRDFASPADVLKTLDGLLVTVKAHTAVINQTVARAAPGANNSESVATIKIQLNLVVDAIKTVTVALGAVGEVLEFTAEEVGKVVSLVLAIVLELVCTVLAAVQALGIQDLLSAVLSNLGQILSALVLILEHVVGGVLALVLEVLNLPAILGLVQGLLGGLLMSLASGKLLPL